MTESSIELLEKEIQAIATSPAMKSGHLKLAIGLCDGMTQEGAYRKAGYKAKDARGSASALIKTNPHILKYVELTKRVVALRSQEMLIGTAEQKRKLLWDIAMACTKLAQMSPEELVEALGNSDDALKMLAANHDPRAAIAAVAELNKMDGDHAETKSKLELTGSLNVATEVTWILEAVDA